MAGTATVGKLMKFTGRLFFWVIGISVVLVWVGPVAAEDLAAALAAGRVSASLHGNGGSSGDSVELVVAKTAAAGAGTLSLTIAPGTRLQSRNAAAQSMVVAGVRGRVVGGDSYEPSSVIEISGQGSTTYLLEGYCMEFDKDNPSSDTVFSVTPPDPVLACILSAAAGLSTEAKQAAVWIYTDHATFAHVNEKFDVSQADCAAAEAAVKKCQVIAKPETVAGPQPAAPRNSSAK